MTDEQTKILKNPENEIRNCVYNNAPNKMVYRTLGKLERALQILMRQILEAQRIKDAKIVEKYEEHPHRNELDKFTNKKLQDAQLEIRNKN